MLECLQSPTANVMLHMVEVSLILCSALDIPMLVVKMLAKEIQVVHLFVTIMVMLSLLALSVGELDVLILIIQVSMPESLQY